MIRNYRGSVKKKIEKTFFLNNFVLDKASLPLIAETSVILSLFATLQSFSKILIFHLQHITHCYIFNRFCFSLVFHGVLLDNAVNINNSRNIKFMTSHFTTSIFSSRHT